MDAKMSNGAKDLIRTGILSVEKVVLACLFYGWIRITGRG